MNHTWSQLGWWVLIALSVLLLHILSPILTPFLLAFLLAYMCNPLVNDLCRLHLPRILAVSLIFIGLLLILLLLMLALIPILERQTLTLAKLIPEALRWLQHTVLPWISTRLHVKHSLNINNLSALISNNLQSAGGIASYIMSTVSQSSKFLIAWISNLLLVPIVGFYLLRDWDSMLENILDLFPHSLKSTVLTLAKQCNEVLGAFFKGQLLVMLSLSILYSIGLLVVGLNIALLIGITAGLLSIVPYLGFILGILTASLAALLQFHDAWHIVYVCLVFGIVQTLESTLLTPLLIGDRIGLHPVTVIFAILAGGQLFGFFGILLALPVAAVGMVLLRHIKARYLASSLYGRPMKGAS